MAVCQRCRTCGQSIGGVVAFGRSMAELFVEVMGREHNGEITAQDFQNDGRRYSFLAKLHYWSLLEQDPNNRYTGVYRITQLARDFACGRAVIPRQVVVHKGTVLQRSPILIDLKTALARRRESSRDHIRNWWSKPDGHETPALPAL